MKDTDNHDRFLIRLLKDQVVVKLRHDEPADLRVTRRGLADAPAEFPMLGEQVGGVENGSADAPLLRDCRRRCARSARPNRERPLD